MRLQGAEVTKMQVDLTKRPETKQEVSELKTLRFSLGLMWMEKIRNEIKGREETLWRHQKIMSGGAKGGLEYL